MRTLAFALILVPTLAAANSCPINNPLVEAPNVPLGCPVVVHLRASHATTFQPILLADRDGQPVDITGSVTNQDETLPVTFLEYDADCNESLVRRDEPFIRSEIQLGAGAMVGDVVTSLGFTVVAAGPCPAAMPPTTYSCSDTGVCQAPDSSDEDGGCSTGGASSLGCGLALLAMMGRRRSRIAS